MALSRRALVLSSTLVLAGCPGGGSGSGNPPPVADTDGPPQTTYTGPSASGTMTSGNATDGTDSTDPPTTGADETTTGGPTTTNCGDLQCSDNGSCEVDAMGNAYCLCDVGYVFDPTAATCIVDESCIQVSFLEDGCRQKIAAEPAVALYFALDFCAGTAITPEKREELGLAFVVRENGIDIAENVESDATILDTSVESYVTLMVDVSNSVTESEDLPALVTELRGLVSALETAPGEPDLYVSVQVFGRQVAEYVPFTRDLQAVDAALDALANDPAPAVDLAGGGQSTALFNATAEGIRETTRMREMRDAVTWGGVLTTGTVVVVTDGLDSSNADLDFDQIQTTTNQVISIGISNDIDDDQLRAIGRDGSFLAPTPAQWTTAFDAIAERVDLYPERSYLLAYCSSASEGLPDVEVSVTGPGVVEVTSAECTFNAELFSSQGFVCSAEFFTGECNALECGGLTGCGSCSDDQCCDGTTCQDPRVPSPEEEFDIFCGEQPHICEAEGRTCESLGILGYDCVLAADEGESCEFLPCALGVGACNDMDVCEPALPVGSSCEVPTDCASLNCYFPNPENPFEGRRCLPEARVGDHCGPSDAVCEAGAFCLSQICTPKHLELQACTSDDQCRKGQCESFGPGQTFCSGPDDICYWDWARKAPN